MRLHYSWVRGSCQSAWALEHLSPHSPPLCPSPPPTLRFVVAPGVTIVYHSCYVHLFVCSHYCGWCCLRRKVKSRPHKSQWETSLKPSLWPRSKRPYGSLQQCADEHLLNGESTPTPNVSVTRGSKRFRHRQWLTVLMNLLVIVPDSRHCKTSQSWHSFHFFRRIWCRLL